jgi:hypothetical protein
MIRRSTFGKRHNGLLLAVRLLSAHEAAHTEQRAWHTVTVMCYCHWGCCSAGQTLQDVLLNCWIRVVTGVKDDRLQTHCVALTCYQPARH